MIKKIAKKTLFIIFLIPIIFLIVPVPAESAGRENAAEIHLSTGGAFYDPAISDSNGMFSRADATLFFTRRIALELSYAKSISELSSRGPSVSMYSGAAVYHFFINNRTVPYVILGLGRGDFLTSNVSSDFTIVNSGGGLKYFFSKDLGVRLDLRDYIITEDFNNNFTVTLGITYVIGTYPPEKPRTEELKVVKKKEEQEEEKEEFLSAQRPATIEEEEMYEAEELPGPSPEYLALVEQIKEKLQKKEQKGQREYKEESQLTVARTEHEVKEPQKPVEQEQVQRGVLSPEGKKDLKAKPEAEAIEVAKAETVVETQQQAEGPWGIKKEAGTSTGEIAPEEAVTETVTESEGKRVARKEAETMTSSQMAERPVSEISTMEAGASAEAVGPEVAGPPVVSMVPKPATGKKPEAVEKVAQRQETVKPGQVYGPGLPEEAAGAEGTVAIEEEVAHPDQVSTAPKQEARDTGGLVSKEWTKDRGEAETEKAEFTEAAGASVLAMPVVPVIKAGETEEKEAPVEVAKIETPQEQTPVEGAEVSEGIKETDQLKELPEGLPEKETAHEGISEKEAVLEGSPVAEKVPEAVERAPEAGPPYVMVSEKATEEQARVSEEFQPQRPSEQGAVVTEGVTPKAVEEEVSLRKEPEVIIEETTTETAMKVKEGHGGPEKEGSVSAGGAVVGPAVVVPPAVPELSAEERAPAEVKHQTGKAIVSEKKPETFIGSVGVTAEVTPKTFEEAPEKPLAEVSKRQEMIVAQKQPVEPEERFSEKKVEVPETERAISIPEGQPEEGLTVPGPEETKPEEVQIIAEGKPVEEVRTGVSGPVAEVKKGPLAVGPEVASIRHKEKEVEIEKPWTGHKEGPGVSEGQFEQKGPATAVATEKAPETAPERRQETVTEVTELPEMAIAKEERVIERGRGSQEVPAVGLPGIAVTPVVPVAPEEGVTEKKAEAEQKEVVEEPTAQTEKPGTVVVEKKEEKAEAVVEVSPQVVEKAKVTERPLSREKTEVLPEKTKEEATRKTEEVMVVPEVKKGEAQELAIEKPEEHLAPETMKARMETVAEKPLQEQEAPVSLMKEVEVKEKTKDKSLKQQFAEELVLTCETEFYYGFNSIDMDQEAHRKLNELISTVKGYSIKKVYIEGHSCAHGSARYNMKLSKQRALKVKEYLRKKLNLPEDVFVIRAFGETRLKYPEIPTPENKNDPEVRMNRRVVVRIEFIKQKDHRPHR